MGIPFACHRVPANISTMSDAPGLRGRCGLVRGSEGDVGASDAYPPRPNIPLYRPELLAVEVAAAALYASATGRNDERGITHSHGERLRAH